MLPTSIQMGDVDFEYVASSEDWYVDLVNEGKQQQGACTDCLVYEYVPQSFDVCRA